MNVTATPAAGYTILNALTDIVAAPAQALDEIRSHPRWCWWPLLILVALTIGMYAYYWSWVDFEWFVDETIRQAMDKGAPADQAEGMRSFFSPGRQMLFSSIAICVMTLVILAVQAVYLHLVNKVAGDPSLGYGQWFSFSAWTSFVGIVNALAGFAVMLLADGNQLPYNELLPLSMNSLFIHAEAGDAWFNWGNSLTLVNFWTLGLMVLGFARWTRSSTMKAALVTVTPWVLIFGIWALLVAT